MRERTYQAMLINKLNVRFPGCLILKNDSSYRQGIPDILILHNDTWAALEIKSSANASIRPNQEHYIDKMNFMSFASFISPDNEEEVLDALQHAFSSNRSARRPKRKQVPLD